MNRYETNKRNSFDNSSEVMDRNQIIWNADDVVKTDYEKIKTLLSLLGKNHEKQMEKGNSGTILKKGLKKELIALTVKLSESGVSYAVTQNNPVLEASLKLTKSQLEACGQVKLYDVVSVFYKRILPLKEFLKHLDSGDMEKEGQLLADYKASIPVTGADKDETQTATLNIGETIKTLNQMFLNLNKHIAPYKYKYPDFYNDYMNSRKVTDLKGKSKTKTTKTKAA